VVVLRLGLDYLARHPPESLVEAVPFRRSTARRFKPSKVWRADL
jgi:hypothetical protein